MAVGLGGQQRHKSLSALRDTSPCMAATPSTPHDGLFKKTFGDPQHAVGELKTLLPERIAQRIDWSTLRIESTIFVDENLLESRSDLLYTVNLDGKPVFLYVLFEHQSTEDHWMGYRLLCYMTEIWKQWLGCKENQKAKRLPAILPMVLFHGEHPWSSSLEFLDLIDLDAADKADVADYMPCFRFLLDDLSQVPEEVLQRRTLTPQGRLTLALLQQVRYLKELRSFLVQWLPVFRALVAKQQLSSPLQVLVYYMLRVGPESRPGLEKLMAEFLGETGRKAVQTAGDLLIQEGIQKGLQEGVQKGVQKGLQEGIQKGLQALRNNLLKVLEKRAIPVSDDEMARIRACSNLQLLERWFDHALDADTIHDVWGNTQ